MTLKRVHEAIEADKLSKSTLTKGKNKSGVNLNFKPLNFILYAAIGSIEDI